MQSLLSFVRANAPWLATGFLLTFASSFGQTFFISIYSGQIQADFGLSNGQWGAIYSAATFTSAMTMIAAGGLTDRFRVRHLGPGVLIGLALAAVAMAANRSVVGLIVVIYFLRLMGQGMMFHTAMVAMARWFVATRGRAVSLAGLGVAVGEAALPLGFVLLLGAVSWRHLWVLAAVALLALTPVIYRLLQHERTPQSFATGGHSAGMGGRDWTRAEVLRHGLFWLMVPAMLGPSTWVTAFFFQQAEIATAKGWTHLQLVQLFPLFTLASVGCMMLAGSFVDRFGAGRLACIYLLPGVAGFWLLALVATPMQAAGAVMLLGAMAGMNSTLLSTFWAEYFGTRHLGKIRSMTTAVMVVGTAVGPLVSGTLIDLGIDFPHQGYGIGLYFLAATLLAIAGVWRVRAEAPHRVPA